MACGALIAPSWLERPALLRPAQQLARQAAVRRCCCVALSVPIMPCRVAQVRLFAAWHWQLLNLGVSADAAAGQLVLVGCVFLCVQCACWVWVSACPPASSAGCADDRPAACVFQQLAGAGSTLAPAGVLSWRCKLPRAGSLSLCCVLCGASGGAPACLSFQLLSNDTRQTA